ncbi:sigma-70 family RNA polymerase sigma factor, partial [Geminocystis sp. GBBB08]|uniref:sigma-70 family RNA polymerase sigma factor n=1 Tax=Geminocystis sp. GBBB08 TaxID=2604140 RepID=UPI0027E302B8
DKGQSPDDFTDYSCLQFDLNRMMSELTQQQQDVIRLRYGLDDGKPLTLSKIGEILKISRERVRQIEREALTKLRENKHLIMDYLYNDYIVNQECFNIFLGRKSQVYISHSYIYYVYHINSNHTIKIDISQNQEIINRCINYIKKLKELIKEKNISLSTT